MVTVSGFIAEVGDIGRFDNPKQLQKLAGYAIVANDSGKHNGESRISYRGRKRLRYVLYEAAVSLVGKNAEFREIHEYYRTRKENPLKKMQSVVAVACKILRIFYTILTKGVEYDPEKLLGTSGDHRYGQHNKQQEKQAMPCHSWTEPPSDTAGS